MVFDVQRLRYNASRRKSLKRPTCILSLSFSNAACAIGIAQKHCTDRSSRLWRLLGNQTPRPNSLIPTHDSFIVQKVRDASACTDRKVAPHTVTVQRTVPTPYFDFPSLRLSYPDMDATDFRLLLIVIFSSALAAFGK